MLAKWCCYCRRFSFLKLLLVGALFFVKHHQSTATALQRHILFAGHSVMSQHQATTALFCRFACPLDACACSLASITDRHQLWLHLFFLGFFFFHYFISLSLLSWNPMLHMFAPMCRLFVCAWYDVSLTKVTEALGASVVITRIILLWWQTHKTLNTKKP